MNGLIGRRIFDLVSNLRRSIIIVKNILLELLDDYRARRLLETYDLSDNYKRIYHYHIRKTGGTSLNNMFLSLVDRSGYTETQYTAGNNLYFRLPKMRGCRSITEGRVFVG